MPNRWVSEGGGGVPGARWSPWHSGLVWRGSASHTSLHREALNKGSVGGTRLRVESGGGALYRVLGVGAKRLCVSWAQCGSTPCGFLPAESPLPQPQPWGWLLPTPHTRQGRVALPAWTSLEVLSAQRGPKNGPLPGSAASGPWSCCQVWAGLGGPPGARIDEWVGQTPQLPKHTHTHKHTRIHASRAWRMRVIPRTMASLTSLWAVQPPCPHPTPCHHLPCLHS